MLYQYTHIYYMIFSKQEKSIRSKRVYCKSCIHM